MPKDITILHVSDLHFGRHNDDASEHDRTLLDKLYAKYKFGTTKTTYLMVTGDFVHGLQPWAWNRQWTDVGDALDKFKERLFVCIGNRDLGLAGTDDAYNEMCSSLGVSPPSNRRDILDVDAAHVDLLGIDSTWHFPGLGIAGIGVITDDQMQAVRPFADAPKKGWKLLYLHHRPVEPNLSAGAREAVISDNAAQIRVHQTELQGLITHDLLALVNANELLDTVRNKVDILAFGHHADFVTDMNTSNPMWVNSNREETLDTGWVEMTFGSDQCTIRALRLDETEITRRTITRV